MSDNDTTHIPSSQDLQISAEELLGPPKIDITGMGMILLLALVVGFLSSVGVILMAFLTFGQFSLDSGISPLLLGMITFFSLTCTNAIYIWGARVIFPHVYSGTRMVFLHASIFSVILYIVIAPMYMMADTSMTANSHGILMAYVAHVLINVFGLEVITSILSGYRYTILSIYSSIVSFVISGELVMYLYEHFFSGSSSALFILLGLSTLASVVSIILVFLIRLCYYRYYLLSGHDPLGDVFSRIQQEEKETEQEAEKQLFAK